jgi:hypothetical protein
MENDPTNEQRLRDAGVIVTDDPLPDEYADVIEGLESDEVETIIEVKNKVAAAEAASGTDAIHVLFPP